MESFPNRMSRFNYVEPLGIPTREEDDEKAGFLGPAPIG